MEGAVAGLQGRPLGAGQPAEGAVQRVSGQGGVELGQGVPQPPLQDHLAVVGPLGVGRVGSDVGAVGDLPAEALQPGQRGLFDVGLGDGGHG